MLPLVVVFIPLLMWPYPTPVFLLINIATAIGLYCSQIFVKVKEKVSSTKWTVIDTNVRDPKISSSRLIELFTGHESVVQNFGFESGERRACRLQPTLGRVRRGEASPLGNDCGCPRVARDGTSFASSNICAMLNCTRTD